MSTFARNQQANTTRSQIGQTYVPRKAKTPVSTIPILSALTTVPVGQTVQVISTRTWINALYEGLIVGYRYWLSSENYATSPFYLSSFGGGTVTGASGDIGELLAPPMVQAMTASRWDWFVYPVQSGVFFGGGNNKFYGFTFTNNEADVVQVEAGLLVQAWAPNARPAWVDDLLRLED